MVDSGQRGDLSGAEPESLGPRVKELRARRRWTLNELAEHSGVSRAMLSKIERGEKSPTLHVAARIARALGVGLSELAGETSTRRSGVITPRDGRVVFRDERSGFVRELISPPFENRRFELVQHWIPPGATTGRLSAYPTGVEKQIIVEEGSLRVVVGAEAFVLQPGDGLFFDANIDHEFANAGDLPCRYYLVVTSPPG